MRIDGIELPTSTITPTPARVMDSWQVGQVLNAVVVSTDTPGTMTLKINGAQIQAHIQSQLHRQPPALPGQSLQLQVTSTGGQTILKVMDLSAVNPITQALRTALPRQTALVPLLTNIALLTDSIANPGANKLPTSVPQPATQLAQQLFNNLTSTVQAATAVGFKEAINNSGMFLESKLASLAGTNLTIEDTGIRLPLSLDFKAGLLLLRETLLTASTPLSSPQATPMVLRTESASPIFRNAPPPMLGAIVPAVTTSAGLNSALELTTMLATQVEGALARLHINQLASLSNTPNSPLWAIELPLRRDNKIDLIQLRIEQDAASHTAHAQERPWSISMGFELDDLGSVYARITLLGEQVSVTLWAEENTTAILANHNIEQLQDGLTQAGFHAGALHCQQGKPPHIMPIDTLLTGAISLLDTHA